MPSGEHAIYRLKTTGSLGDGNATFVLCCVVTCKVSPKAAENRLDNKHIVAGIAVDPLTGRPAAQVELCAPCAAAE